MIFFFLCIISIVEVFSASSFLTYKTANYWAPLTKHVGTIIMGLAVMLGIQCIPCKYFKIMTLPMLALSFGMLIFVLLFGESTNGASRWVGVGSVQFQPSEIAKGSLVLAVAQILSAMQTEKGVDKQAFWWVLGISAFIVIPILLENFSTACLLSAVVFLMMVIGRVPFSQLGRLMGIIIISALLAFLAVLNFGDETQVAQNEDKAKTTLVETNQQVASADNQEGKKRRGILHRMDTWKARIMKFSRPPVAPDKYDLDKDAQVAHANIAIIKSNGIGCGPGNSEERDFLSQAFSDFIFAIIIEEMGVGGAIAIAALYIFLFFRAGHIAKQCANTFPAYLVMGLSLLLVMQAFANMAVAVGWLPVTGQPLPLISKGGTSTVINCVYLAMILSVSRTAKKREKAPAPVPQQPQA